MKLDYDEIELMYKYFHASAIVIITLLLKHMIRCYY